MTKEKSEKDESMEEENGNGKIEDALEEEMKDNDGVMEDEDYEAGDGYCLDIIDMFGENYSNMMTQIMNILRIIGIITFYRVLKRQDFNTFEIFFFIISRAVFFNLKYFSTFYFFLISYQHSSHNNLF